MTTRRCAVVAGRCPVCQGATQRGRRCCSPACYRTWAADHVWTHARRVALTNAEWACAICGRTDGDTDLDVHHTEPVNGDYRNGCQHHQSNLVVLCRQHHADLHRGRRGRRRARHGEQRALFAA